MDALNWNATTAEPTNKSPDDMVVLQLDCPAVTTVISFARGRVLQAEAKVETHAAGARMIQHGAPYELSS